MRTPKYYVQLRTGLIFYTDKEMVHEGGIVKVDGYLFMGETRDSSTGSKPLSEPIREFKFNVHDIVASWKTGK